MNYLDCYGKKLRDLCSGLRLFFCCYYRYLLFRVSPFFIYVFYFVSLSFVGFGILKALNPRTTFTPRNIDLLFTCVSATTVSSMSTVEMEAFSNAQLLVITILMFIGGEVFTSMVGLHLKRSKIFRTWESDLKVESVHSDNVAPPPPADPIDGVQLTIVTVPESGVVQAVSQQDVLSLYNPSVKYDSIRFLGYVVLGYLLVTPVLGVASVLIYVARVPSAEIVLKDKGLKTFTFVIFTVVSTFASCGFVPTNENMAVFRKNSGLLWILIPQTLLGNTLFPPCLRVILWVLGKKFKKTEAKYLLKKTTEAGYIHLLPGLHSVFLTATVFGFILVGFVKFCAMEWNSASLSGLNTYQKVVGIIFQCVNARHTGETVVDLSTIAPAMLAFFVVMMYLPPYTSFLPIKRDEPSSVLKHEGGKKRRKGAAEKLVFSQLTYLVIFIILVCITERKSLKEDPLNFNVLNITVEVISAYGNVGFTTGYSCDRQLRPDPNCMNKCYGFSGKWSDEGKVILIIVMVFGRLKKFNMKGGEAWKLW